MTKRIVIYTKSFLPSIGGLEKLTHNLAEFFSRNGYYVIVLTETPAQSQLDDANLPYHVRRIKHITYGMLDIFRSHYTISMGLSIPFFIFSMIFGKRPLVHHGNGYYSSHPIKYYVERVKINLLPFCRNVVPGEFMRGYLGVESEIIPNPYDDRFFFKDESVRSRDFIFCGRLSRHKGAHLIIGALPQIFAARGPVTLTIVGAGPEKSRLFDLTRKLGLESHVFFEGALFDQKLGDQMRNHKVLVVPTIWEEPFGIVALEGLACCDGVIVSSLGGLSDAVGVFGVTAYPNEVSFAEAMISALESIDDGKDDPRFDSTDAKADHLKKHSIHNIGMQYKNLLERSK